MRPICAVVIVASFLSVSCSRPSEPPKNAGDIATEASSPEALSAKADIPIYPDATLPEKQSNVRTDGKQARYEIVMMTDDAPQKVSDYYVKELNLQSKKVDSGFELMGLTPKGAYAIVNVKPQSNRTKIVAVSVVP
jgi:hypothetical protein